tara:strand:- start:1083 stop:3551 length:2469 start_codon:yes stop_codon:yes gene_type:complete
MAIEEIVRIKFEGVDTVNKYTKAIQENQKEAERLKRINEELKKNNKENSEQFIKNASDIRVLSKQQTENKRVVDQLNRARQESNGSISEQRARLSQLKTQYINLSKEERNNAKTGKLLQKEIHKINEELKVQEKEIGITSRNVGNYSDSIVDATTNMGFFGTATRTVVTGFKQATTTVKAMTFGLKGLKGALVATGIGAFAVALGSLTAFFTSTKRGAEALTRATAFLGAAFDVIIDRASAMGERMFKALSEPKQLAIDFGNTLKTFVIDKVSALGKGFGLLGETMISLFKGDFADARKSSEQMGEEFSKLVPTLVATEEASKGIRDSIKDLVKEMVDEGNQASILEGRLQKLRDAERVLQVQQAERRTEINKLRQAVKDETNTFEERQQALTKAQEIQNKLSDEELRVAKQRVDIITAQLALGENLEEDEQRLADARLRQAEIEEERQKRLIKFTTEQNLITNQQIAIVSKLENIRRKGLETATKLEQEFLAEIEKTRIEAIENDQERELASIDFKHDQEIKKLQEKFNKVAGLTEAEKEKLARLEQEDITKANEKDLQELERLRAKLEAKVQAEDEFNQLLLEKDEVFLKKKQALLNESQVEQLKIVQGIGQSIGQEFANILADQTKTGKDFIKFTIRMVLDALNKVVIAKMVESQVSGIALGPAGIVAAGLKVAAIQALFTGAKVAISKFAKGGLVDGGMFEGKSHAEGGVKFAVGGKVPQIMEAEGGEAIINKRSTAMYKPLLSAINQMGGGKKFAVGGITPSISPEVSNPLLSLSGLSTEIGSIVNSRLDKIKVINVVSETTQQQNTITNVESEAIF